MASFAMALPSKKEEESGLSSYYNNKTTIIQEARVFNESPISPRKCRALLTRIVYLLYVGETFGTQEATTLFFGTTKLFQHKDSALRQAVYLAIKELATTAEDVIMVTSSIMKDMQPNSEVIYRPNAIRALCRIIDPSMAQGVERFFKAAIVDRNPSISSAALVSAYHLFPHAKDVVKRWVNEAQEAVSSKSSPSFFGSSSGGGYLGFGGSSQPSGAQSIVSSSYVTQYHALGLLYLIRQQDRMAVTKMIQQLGGGKSGSGTTLKNPMALCMLIRYTAKVIEEDPNVQKPMLELLDGWLRHKSDMVNFEAARVICEMKNVSAPQLTKAISVLQLFLSSPKPVLKFAATRTLAALALSHPASVATCNVDLESLIADPNRSVATYAITTLLKTGNEASVDRLIKQISGFMSEISDEFKVIIVDAIRSLCLKFPTKHASMLTFLSGVLRDEGGYDFKRAVVEAMFDMIKFIADAKEQALSHLCEFIEDCEFTKLSVRILHLLGMEGPKSPQPAKYIRFIYNRVVLENATVRAAAVASLAKFGVNSLDAALKKSITVLLRRCLDDVDDEVRDRAALYLKVFTEKPLADTYVKEESVFSLAALEAKLVAYVKDPAAVTQPFDVSSIPKISRSQAAQEAARPSTLDTYPIGVPTSKKVSASPPPPSAAEKQSAYAQQLAEVPEFSSYGPVQNSSITPAQLTESETEYQVTCVKHIFAEHVVFQFNVSNTLPDTVLENVSVFMQPQTEDSDLTEDFIIPLPSLTAANSPNIVYVSLTKSQPYALASFACTLRFLSKELDPSTGEPEEEGYEDEYQLEGVELSAADYIVPTYVTFEAEWDRLRSSPSSTETFALSAMESIKAACDSIIEVLNMEPLGGTESPTSTSVHTLQLSGLVTGGGGKVVVRCRMTFSQGQGVTLELGRQSGSARPRLYTRNRRSDLRCSGFFFSDLYRWFGDVLNIAGSDHHKWDDVWSDTAVMAPSTPSLPSAKVIHVDTRGAVILSEESPETRDSRGIYFPNYIEPVSHIAVDVGGSLAKVVYFTRSPDPPSSPSVVATSGSSSPSNISTPLSLSPSNSQHGSPSSNGVRRNGALTPLVLDPHNHSGNGLSGLDDGRLVRDSLIRRTSQHFPGGSLNFERFETEKIHECVDFIQGLIQRSAEVNNVSIEEMRAGVKIMATGGGAHKFYELFKDTLQVEVRREDEMECLIEGLKFITLIPDEVYYFSDELIHSASHAPPGGSKPSGSTACVLERPSPNPPAYGVEFVSNPTPQLPCLLVNIGSGVSIIKVDEDGKYERVSGTSLGGGTLWGLLSLLTPATTFDEMLAFSDNGDNAAVDMLVGDIYGQDYSKLGLKSTMIASSFGKVFKKGGKKGNFSPEDISRSLLYAVSNNIGQIAYMNAEKYNLDRIYFGGCFIRGHAATITTLSYAIRFWSKGTKRALFLRHEGFLGAIGAWIRNIDSAEDP
ncbi:putative the coatomer is a cytosolic protein complex that binds to dilysine motifs and reversibly associates with Golgi non- clathrin-coated vesicles, which further mediate biosynthetic protein transport from the ER, via the Golgi up to the trans Golgi network [Lyophyllum shimeji]|uniref:Gamma-coat protein n=1 Tax=Lyophyllum shimeji TaxID=47721 RepID=A0A9P3PI05_LYOSH|nr:putative the coatomer is a cytosolic protein complex that binds to dilysine motifs and reversibly associates with Golgi non- clathrin-coated vesicles, which further mediate biosynthetic protein transport from the ER, via the Golgi up to the trans Golgi network [Lyophyllum shimeji]